MLKNIDKAAPWVYIYMGGSALDEKGNAYDQNNGTF